MSAHALASTVAALDRIAATSQATLRKARTGAERVLLEAQRCAEAAEGRDSRASLDGSWQLRRQAPARSDAAAPPSAAPPEPAEAGGCHAPGGANAWPAAREMANELEQLREELRTAVEQAAASRAAAAEATAARDAAQEEMHACKAELRATSALSAMEIEAAEARVAQLEDQISGAAQAHPMREALERAQAVIREQEAEIETLLEHARALEAERRASRAVTAEKAKLIEELRQVQLAQFEAMREAAGGV
jgi:hypothetical protein